MIRDPNSPNAFMLVGIVCRHNHCRLTNGASEPILTAMHPRALTTMRFSLLSSRAMSVPPVSLKHAPAESKSVFESALSDQNTGLLVQGRLLNVPPQIIPALHGALLEDMSWAQANRAAYGAQFKFKQYVLIGRMFKPPPGSKKALRHDIEPPTQFISPFASKKKQKKAAAAAAAAVSSPADADLPEWDWVRFEEELYARDATAKFTFAAPFTAEDAAAGRLPQNCVVMIVPHNKVVAIAQELAAMAAIV